MSNVGDYIKHKREEKNVTIKQICDKTAIRMQFINLLEVGNFDALPSYVHAHGFLEQYCKVLGLDFYGEVKPLFDQECQKATFGKTPEEIALEQAELENASKKTLYMKISAILAFSLVIVTGFLFYSFIYTPKVADGLSAKGAVIHNNADTGVNNNNDGVQAAGDDLGNNAGMSAGQEDTFQILPSPLTYQDTASQPPSLNNADKRKVVLTFTDQCWVYFKSDTGITEEFTAVRGNEKVIYFSNHFSIDIGNASAISVAYLDKTFSGFGNSGQALKNLYFVVDRDGTMTQQRTPPPPAR